MLQVSKRGPALKHRLVGIAEKYKGLLNRESLRADDGVKYFQDTLRPHFIKGAQSVFFLVILSIYPSKQRKHWDRQVDRPSSHCSWSVQGMHGWTCFWCPSWAKIEEKTSISLTWLKKLLKDKEYMMKPWTLMNMRPGTIGTPHRWPPTKGYFHSVITWQHWCSLLQVIWVKPRERDQQVLSLQGMNVTVSTLEAVKKQCLWNCSARRKVQLRILHNRHRRKFCWRRIWTMCHRRSDWWTRLYRRWKIVFFGHGTTTRKTWQSRPFKGRQARRRKGKDKGGFKRTGRAFLGEAQAQEPEWWSEEDCAWWSKGKKGKKGPSKRKIPFWIWFQHLSSRKRYM